MRAPCNGLDSCLVFTEFVGRLVVELVPHHQLVVVSSRSKLLIFMIPLQTTDLLFVANELPKPLVRLSHIAVVDGTIS